MPKVGNSSDWSSSEDDDGRDEDPVPSFDDITNSKRFPLNVHGTYTNWGPREAFRELIQNWRDAIIESNQMAQKDLSVKREAEGEANGEATPPAGDTEIVYKAFRRNTQSNNVCLGFIRYKGRNGVGTIEISNLKAALQTNNLYFGGTSKKGLDEQAGAHGEGLKLAALVLMRGGQNFRLFGRTTGFNLSFNFNKEGCLYADAHRIVRPKSAQKAKKLAIPTPAVNPNEDVQFIIGECRQGRNEDGNKVKRSPVSQKDFKSWARVALFLTEVGDANIIPTDHGDLLTSEDLRGKLYLKGLLLNESSASGSASLTGHTLGFGYNFAFGTTDRERKQFSDARGESWAICRILSSALLARGDLAGKVCDLLNSAEPRYAEAECKARFWPQKIAVLFKQYLLGGEFASRWLYCGDEMDKNPSLVKAIEGMGRQPFKLTTELWKTLEQYSLVHTAEKEAQRCYKAAPVVLVPDTTFATSMNRLLRACIRACPQTTAMQVEFVDAGQIHLDLFVSKTKPLVRIHKRWLAIDAAIAELGLVGAVVEADTILVTVKRLFADILEHLPPEEFQQQDSLRLPDSLMKQERHRAEQRLANYPKMEVRIVDKRHEGHHGPSLSLKWTADPQLQDGASQIEIQCHQVSSCSHLRDKLLIAADADRHDTACCHQTSRWEIQGGWGLSSESDEPGLPSCRVQRINLRQGTHYEHGLEEGEEYFFVLMTPADPNSLVGVSNTTRLSAESAIPFNQSTSGDKARSDSFSLGPQLGTLEFLELSLDGDRWYKAENSVDVQAVIGIVKGEKVLPDESKKRRRVD